MVESCLTIIVSADLIGESASEYPVFLCPADTKYPTHILAETENIDAAVFDFLKDRNAFRFLAPVLKLADECFSENNGVTCSLVHDPEIPDRSAVSIMATVKNASEETIKQQRKLDKAFVQLVPIQFQEYFHVHWR